MFCWSALCTLKIFALILVRSDSNDVCDMELDSCMLVRGSTSYIRARLRINTNVCPFLLTHAPLPFPQTWILEEFIVFNFAFKVLYWLFLEWKKIFLPEPWHNEIRFSFQNFMYLFPIIFVNFKTWSEALIFIDYRKTFL